MRISDKADRLMAAKSFEDDEDFRAYVLENLESKGKGGEEQYKKMVSLAYAKTDEDFVFRLCQLGYVLFTDYLMEAQRVYDKDRLH